MPRLLLLTPAELTRDPRARRAAAAARDLGYEVVGLCGRVQGEEGGRIEGMEVVRVGPPARVHPGWESGTLPSAREPQPVRELRGLARLGKLAARTARLWSAGRRLGDFEIVHANDLDTLPAAAALALAARARLVYDAHELYSEYEARPPRLYRRAMLWIERALARRASAVVTVSEPLADELHALLGLRRRPLVVPNAPPRTDVDLRFFAEGPLRVIYQGGLGPGRSLDDLLAAAGAPGVELSLRIVLADAAALRRTIADRGLAGAVTVLDSVSAERAVEALDGFEVGIVFDRPATRNTELSAPNKFYEYLMAGLAVVTPWLEGMAPLVEGAGVGLTFEAGNPQALQAALLELAGDRERLAEMRRRARALALERLNAEAAAENLARAWRDTSADGGHRRS